MNAEDVVADIKSSITEKKRKRYSGSQGRRSVKRPEEILRDVRGLKLRQRVSLVLGDEILREELEESIKNSTLNGVTKLDTIRAYQDILLPALQPSLVSVGSGGGGGSTVLPINDIRGEHTGSYTKNERILRCKLASVYRLIDIFGWSEAIFNHISVSAFLLFSRRLINFTFVLILLLLLLDKMLFVSTRFMLSCRKHKNIIKKHVVVFIKTFQQFYVVQKNARMLLHYENI